MGKLKRVLITGASGGIGSALAKRFQGYDLLVPTHKELDLSSVDSISQKVISSSYKLFFFVVIILNLIRQRCQQAQSLGFDNVTKPCYTADS